MMTSPDLMPYAHCPHLNGTFSLKERQRQDRLFNQMKLKCPGAPQKGSVGGNNCNQSVCGIYNDAAGSVLCDLHCCVSGAIQKYALLYKSMELYLETNRL